MTLARQLFSGIIVVFVALLIGIEAIYISRAKGHLEEQLDAHANETATSLALSLGLRSGTFDASIANITVNPVFDRGHFASIEVKSPAGELIFGRKLDRHDIDVPAWFVALVTLEGPKGEALISSGWRQLGKVIVQIHPGYAYQQLYGTALATLIWLAVLFAMALVLVRYYLAGILKPLKEIEQTALAISNRNFVSIAVEPRTLELQRVTAAINSLSTRIRDVISQESGRAERLRKEAFEDPLTGQLNRRGFEQTVGATLNDRREVHSGAVALFAVSGLEDVNRVFGLSRGNEVLKHLADALATAGPRDAIVVGRWQGPTLAAFVPNIDSQAALSWVDAVGKSFSAHWHGEGHAESVALSIGLTHFGETAVTFAGLAQAAEGALAEAVKKGGPVLASLQSAQQDSGGNLRKEIESAIDAKRIALLGQKVISIVGEDVLQVELLGTLSGSDGKVIPAGTFVPIASQHGLLPLLDRNVIEQALAALSVSARCPGP